MPHVALDDIVRTISNKRIQLYDGVKYSDSALLVEVLTHQIDPDGDQRRKQLRNLAAAVKNFVQGAFFEDDGGPDYLVEADRHDARLLRLLGTVTTSRSLSTLHTQRIESPTHHLITYPWQISHTATTHKYDGVLLQTMSFTRNVNGHFFAV